MTENLIAKLRVEGTEEQITEICRRLSKVMLIADKSRNYPNRDNDKYRCYLVVSVGNSEHFQ